MILKVVHDTEYTFEEPVFPEPHILRFHPRTDFHQRVIDYSLQIKPLPAGRNEWLDEYGNIAEICWFSDLNGKLKLSALSIVEIKKFKPFDFLIYPEYYMRLPVNTPANPILKPYLGLGDNSDEIRNLYNELVSKSSYNTLDFLNALTSHLHSSIDVINRETGMPLIPSRTLTEKKGSCRDITVLHMELIRMAGIPARFVSGYHYIHGNDQHHELHAWTEVFLGGAGWIGFDATTGLAVTGNYIAVASGPLQSGTLPVEGTYRGSALSSIKANVDVCEFTDLP